MSKYVIYKIVCDDVPEFVYIGSTTNFTQRKKAHKSDCNNINNKAYNQKVYSTIRENGGWNNWRMVIINECEEGLTKTQAHIIEEEFRVKLNGNMNSIKCFTTKEEAKEYDKEYRENNKDERKEKRKEYYKNNKEQISEKRKEYYEENKEKIKENYEENKEKKLENSKKYYERNKEKKKEYYEINKEKLNEKITCECGCETSKLNLLRHQKTKKHVDLMEKQNETK